MLDTVTPPPAPAIRPAPGATAAPAPRAGRLRRGLARRLPAIVWIAGVVAACWLFTHEPPRPNLAGQTSRSLKAAGDILPR